MEISAKVLREVEFRDRLRGYDTDEVDEFLERVAVGIEELHAEIKTANDRADRAEHTATEAPIADDDSIRRTLVLAQRTADLAIKEAESEAAALLEGAKSEATALLEGARAEAARMRSDAEEQLRSRVDRLGVEHDRLEQEVAKLRSLVDAERGHLADSLQALLSFVNGLDVSPTLHAAADAAPRVAPVETAVPEPVPTAPSAPTPPPQESLSDVLFGDPTDDDPSEIDDELDLSFVERQVSDDAASAVTPPLAHPGEPIAELDPDEELWDRWARSGENDVLGAGENDVLGFGRPNTDS